MKKDDLKANIFWEQINRTNLSNKRIQKLDNFKSSDVNYKLALWNPKTNGIRYLKALVYTQCAHLSRRQWSLLSKIKNRDYGNPTTITYNGQNICLDYLQAVYEADFISRNIKLPRKNILEIGAGYGRTCHALVSNFNVDSYCIVDLKQGLSLARKYLRKVLSKTLFSKISFVSIENFHRLKDSRFDLTINIDSFAEMDRKVVKNYLNYIDNHSRALYVKNPVGKYIDKSLDSHARGKRIVGVALQTGLLRDVIDVHNDKSVAKQVPKFIAVYKPGRSWKCTAQGWATPWSFYWQAIYQNKKKLRK